MGGDDLGSDDECLYASDHSSSVNIHEQESDTDEHINPTIVPTNQKRKADETSVTSSKKKSKKASEESVVAISRQSASEQASFLSKTIVKYAVSLVLEPKGMDVKPGDLATSQKDTLMQRMTDIVAQNKLRKWKHKLSPCVVRSTDGLV